LAGNIGYKNETDEAGNVIFNHSHEVGEQVYLQQKTSRFIIAAYKFLFNICLNAGVIRLFINLHTLLSSIGWLVLCDFLTVTPFAS
jgi:hypothetical protein